MNLLVRPLAAPGMARALLRAVAGLPVIERPDRLVYMPTLAMLVCDLLIGCVPQVFDLPTLPPVMLTVFKYGLLVIPAGIALVPTSRNPAVTPCAR